jgi:hypothetical protein
MPIAATRQAPTWVSSGAVITGGLDLLGLRLPVQFIGGTLLDGVTTVTPSVRYLAFRAWLIRRYGQSGQPDRWQTSPTLQRGSNRRWCSATLRRTAPSAVSSAPIRRWRV